MYTVSKGPSKIVAKTRRGIPHTQNIERLEILRDQLTKKSADTVEDDSSILLNGPKPVFHTVNGKRSSSVRSQQEAITPQHAALINFVYESWEQVCREYEQEPLQQGASQARPTVVYYNDGECNSLLQDFKPFDLESWWGKRLFNNITKSI
ncbi:MAPK regulated corepressor interacting protein 2-like isoform X3 [Bacillus rossius redtenbacheri]|uniref:MAPK regulated corepressor interacting protein 2-like isoform X3 n=1 Tax=Bacillus rossius redtenbacheri TaxID=93214 RepID=UPI002FDDF65D